MSEPSEPDPRKIRPDTQRHSRTDLESATNLLMWLQGQQDRTGEVELDENEYNALWTAMNTALVFIKVGEIGYQHAQTLMALLNPERPERRLSFSEAARLSGPVWARLQAEVTSPSPQELRRRRGPTVTMRIDDPRHGGSGRG